MTIKIPTHMDQTQQPTTLLDTVGKTPLVSLERSPEDVPIYAKLESFNPGGSVKDRIGKHILERALSDGLVPPGGTIIEPTAGNTGIGMAIAANQLGLNTIFVLPRGFSEEKEELMAALGAQIEHVPNEAGMQGAADRAFELASERDDAIVPQQFQNTRNVDAHEATTGPEVVEALDGKVGALVVGIGSAGTLMGMARAIRRHEPDLHVVAVEPGGSLFGERFGKSRAEAPYKTEGIGTHDPTVTALLEPAEVDDIVSVDDEQAHAELKRLAAEEGHLVGSSAGAASVAAYEIATAISNNELAVPHPSVVTVFPDGSERYLSKNIYGSFDAWEGKG